MLSKAIANLAVKNGLSLKTVLSKNIATTSAVLNTVDPVQQVFVDKVREYYKRKSASKTGLVDTSPESVKALNDELEKVNRQFGATGQKFEEFPSFQFQEPKLDSMNQEQK